ncbi:MAG: PKD domain-containing protein [Bacteroidetes bacterium]|nr:MAG: PKD domain-containing protein [Bacteroidota bacterium]
MKKLLLLPVVTIFSGVLFAQDTVSSVAQYDRIKREGGKPVLRHVDMNYSSVLKPLITQPPQTQSTTCNCMIPVDNTFSVVPFSFSSPPDYRNDDDSSPLISLPFTFCFYGQNQTGCYINNNGNISFGAPYGTFSAVGFPSAQFSMVAPFWADVDTRNTGSGLVYYKVTNTALIVRWQTVGYYSMYIDKLNDFQLIITDGTDPLIPGGNNVSFCYSDMQWTTGDASQGVNGFGGIPATVGANLGNGIDYIQFGQFDAPGTNYDGPLGAVDQVSWLDNQNFVFNTCNIGNIPPIPNLVVSGAGIDTLTVSINCGDTLRICEGNTLNLMATFFAPEATQTVTATANGPSGLVINYNFPGTAAIISASFTPTSANYGYNTITFTGTDNGTPPQSASSSVVFFVDTFQLPPPVISGPDEYCQGSPGVTLNVNNPPYDSIYWSNGVINNTTITNVTAGNYIVTVEDSGCFKMDTFLVTMLLQPNPVISGMLNFCGNTTTLSATSPAYASYNWSNGDTTGSVIVGSGTYTVAVTDTNGCTGPSQPVTVNANPVPAGAFTSSPLISFPGAPVNFTDQSSVSSGNIVSWFWTFGDGDSSFAQNPAHVYQNPGTYTVCLHVATSTPCYDTICFPYEVQPFDVTAPNVFTPNRDGNNDMLVFDNLQYFPNAMLIVYNRWGNKVYESTNYTNNWDGDKVSDGVYYYVLTAPDLKEPKTGFVHILRGQ